MCKIQHIHDGETTLKFEIGVKSSIAFQKAVVGRLRRMYDTLHHEMSDSDSDLDSCSGLDTLGDSN